MARYGGWDDRPEDERERGRYGERWHGEGVRGGWMDEERRLRPREGWRGVREEYREEERPERWRETRRREIDPPWVELGPGGRGREDRRGLMEWEDRGPLERLGARARGEGARPRGPKGWVRSDERIRDEVCERIARSGVDASDLEIEVKDREVTLSGTVRSRPEKWRIEELADDVFGVDEIHNRVRVSREAGAGRAGEDEGRELHH